MNQDPDLSKLAEAVVPQILDAMRAASPVWLSDHGFRHVLIGGLAVGAWGVPRASRDVNFLVGREAYAHHAAGIVTMQPGVPISINGVPVDCLEADEILDKELRLPEPGAGPPVISVPALILMKLRA